MFVLFVSAGRTSFVIRRSYHGGEHGTTVQLFLTITISWLCLLLDGAGCLHCMDSLSYSAALVLCKTVWPWCLHGSGEHGNKASRTKSSQESQGVWNSWRLPHGETWWEHQRASGRAEVSFTDTRGSAWNWVKQWVMQNQEPVGVQYKNQKLRGGLDYHCDSMLLPVQVFLFQETCRNECL